MAVPALALLKNADGYEDVVLLSKGVVEIAESQSVCNDARTRKVQNYNDWIH